MWEERQKLGDFCEQRLFKLISEGNERAILFYLTTMCKDRGYLAPKGTPLNADVTNSVTIGSVVINPIRSGDHLAEPPDMLEGREPSSVVPLRVIEGDKRRSF